MNNFRRTPLLFAGALLLASSAGYYVVSTELKPVYARPPAGDKQTGTSPGKSVSKDSEADNTITPEPSAPQTTPSVIKDNLATTASTEPAPLAINRSMTLYADPTSNVAVQARTWAASHPNDASKMNRLAETPMAKWFGEWSGDVRAAANNYVSPAANVGQVPTLIAYNIPQRDCGSYSAGGSSSSAAYKSWIDSFAAGIGQRKAIVILEPDALAGMDCLNAADQQTRIDLVSYGVQALRNHSQAAIYIDAGHTTWQTAGVMANRLKAANIANATGFSLNISNFQTTSSNTNYGASISSLVDNKHFVIDTSRNGNGPTSGDMAWCNPDGRAFGAMPTLQTGTSVVDAYLWLKNPGESDGNCGSTQFGVTPPPAGGWWPEYVLMLAIKSNW